MKKNALAVCLTLCLLLSFGAASPATALAAEQAKTIELYSESIGPSSYFRTTHNGEVTEFHNLEGMANTSVYHKLEIDASGRPFRTEARLRMPDLGYDFCIECINSSGDLFTNAQNPNTGSRWMDYWSANANWETAIDLPDDFVVDPYTSGSNVNIRYQSDAGVGKLSSHLRFELADLYTGESYTFDITIGTAFDVELTETPAGPVHPLAPGAYVASSAKAVLETAFGQFTAQPNMAARRPQVSLSEDGGMAVSFVLKSIPYEGTLSLTGTDEEERTVYEGTGNWASGEYTYDAVPWRAVLSADGAMVLTIQRTGAIDRMELSLQLIAA